MQARDTRRGSISTIDFLPPPHPRRYCPCVRTVLSPFRTVCLLRQRYCLSSATLTGPPFAAVQACSSGLPESKEWGAMEQHAIQHGVWSQALWRHT